MRTTIVAAALLAGVAPAALRAQETPPPAPEATPAPVTTPAPPPVGEFRGPDGKPLPPEVEAQLRARFKEGLPPGARIVTGTPGAGGPDTPGRDIVVRGQRPRGSVIGDIPPERSFSPVDIRAYGAGSVEELLGALGPQLGSGRGRDDAGPVVLLNGKRVSSFAEIARIPTEAIERMDVLPEEVALKYGYRADQKVVNVVVYERFSSRLGQATLAAPTDGGRETLGATANYFRIQGEARYTFDADYARSGKLTEGERDVRQVAGAPAGLANARTLLPSTERLALNGTVAGTILGDVNASLNGRFEASANEALLGLGRAGEVLSRDVDARFHHLGTTLGGRTGAWQWTLTGNYDRTRTETLTDRGDGGPRDTARAVNALAGADLLLAGPLLALPAGPLFASIRGGVDVRDFESRSLVGVVARAADLGRDRGGVQASVDLPIAGTATPGLRKLGTLSANANLQVERLSDVGTLATYGYGLNWSPSERVNLLASVTVEEGAPAVEQLGAPLVVTPNARLFDFTRGETVDVTRVAGGNPGLRPDDRRVWSLGITVKPLARTDLTLTLDYTDTRIDDPIATLPVALPAVEAAFPERFARDGDGRLLRVDATPLNFARSDQQQLRWGVNFVRPLGAVPPGVSAANIRYVGSAADVQRRLPPGAIVNRVEPGSPAARRFENLSSRLTLGLQHSWRLEDEVLLRPGTPVLDLLDGGALDARGGRPRHEVELQAGAFKRGLGARLTATWQSGTSVRGLGPDGDLDFSALTTVNLSLFANVATYLGPKAPGWTRGLRLSLEVANLFDQRPEVRDAAGDTPINFQRAYLNPLGRQVSLSLRKLL